MFASSSARVRWLFVAAVPCLLLQLGVRRFTEPYPAVLLPAGGNALVNHGSYSILKTEYAAEDAAGRLYPFSAEALLDTVPEAYRAGVAARGFGLWPETPGEHRPQLLGRRLVMPGWPRPTSQSQLAATRAWLRRRLQRSLGIDAARLRFRRSEVSIVDGETDSRRPPVPQWEKVADLRESP